MMARGRKNCPGKTTSVDGQLAAADNFGCREGMIVHMARWSLEGRTLEVSPTVRIKYVLVTANYSCHYPRPICAVQALLL